MRKKMKPGLGVIEVLVILAILVCIIFYFFSGNDENLGSEKLDKQVITSTAEYLAHIDHLSDQLDEVSAQCDSLEAQNKVLKKKYTAMEKKFKMDIDNSKIRKYKHHDGTLTKKQLERADEIAYITYRNYDRFGILPSIAVSQSMEETHIGMDETSATPYYGWFGVTNVDGGYALYDSLEEAVVDYLNVLNNGRYSGAVFTLNASKSAMSIQNGGYCEPREGYASRIMDSYTDYNFCEYDRYYLGIE